MSEQIAWLESSRKYIEKDLQDVASKFISLGYHLWEVARYEYYKEDGYVSVHEFAEVEFGIKKSTCYNYINLMQTFSRDRRSVFLDDKYQGFNYSQLVEMLSMSDISKVRKEYTVAQIREIKKHGNIVDTDIQKKELVKFAQELREKCEDNSYSFTRANCKNIIDNLKKRWSMSFGYGGKRYFTPHEITIDSYKYDTKSLLDLIEKYVGFDVPEKIQADELDEPLKIKKNSEIYELNHDDTLSDALMNILTGHIKNVDKVAALIEFIDTEIKFCMRNSCESRRLE